MAYLVDNPPRIQQYRPRRAALWPVIGVHTAESFPDETGLDTGAENVARFIRDRTNYGSYHCLSDSDSRIQLVPFDQAAYHIGTHGLNDRTIGISAATQAARWDDLDDDYRDAMVRNMARDAADAARWLKAKHGLTVPARRITLAQALNGQAGFLAHGDADPDRRADPGASFPWTLFLATYADLMGGTDPEDDMATPAEMWGYKNPKVEPGNNDDAYSVLLQARAQGLYVEQQLKSLGSALVVIAKGLRDGSLDDAEYQAVVKATSGQNRVVPEISYKPAAQ
jgi:hypothetical protein